MYLYHPLVLAVEVTVDRAGADQRRAAPLPQLAAAAAGGSGVRGMAHCALGAHSGWRAMHAFATAVNTIVHAAAVSFIVIIVDAVVIHFVIIPVVVALA